MISNKDYIINILNSLDIYLKKEFQNQKIKPISRYKITITGSAALILQGYEIEREFGDIDVLELPPDFKNISLDGFLEDQQGQLIDELPNDYIRRVKDLEDYQSTYIDYKILGIEDLIISKMRRGQDKDFDDLKYAGVLNIHNVDKMQILVNDFTGGNGRVWDNFKDLRKECQI